MSLQITKLKNTNDLQRKEIRLQKERTKKLLNPDFEILDDGKNKKLI